MADVEVKILDWQVDDRGTLVQVYEAGALPEVKRIYVVENFSKGTVRGFHKHEREWKCFFVSRGSVKFVTVKDGEEPKVFVLTDKKPQLLVIPPGRYNGWQSLEDDTLLIGLSNFTLKESLEDDSRIDPFAFGKDLWGVKPR